MIYRTRPERLVHRLLDKFWLHGMDESPLYMPRMTSTLSLQETPFSPLLWHCQKERGVPLLNFFYEGRVTVKSFSPSSRIIPRDLKPLQLVTALMGTPFIGAHQPTCWENVVVSSSVVNSSLAYGSASSTFHVQKIPRRHPMDRFCLIWRGPLKDFTSSLSRLSPTPS